jgi:DinB superfamily
VISADDFLWYVDEALNGMVAIVESLGDEGANRRPDLPGANSAYAILFHCLGVMDYWGGQVVAGRTIERDRDAEFRATGSVSDLAARARRARAQLVEDMAGLDPAAAPRRPLAPDDPDAGLPIARTQGGALIHIYEELAQHRGQMELTRDVIVSAG